MATQVIPTSNASNFGNFYFVVELDGLEYQIFLKYNDREGVWYMDLSDTKGNAIRSGVKLSVNFPVLRLAMIPERPPGEIIALDTTTPPADPDLTGLDQRVALIYEQQESLP
jgi:hypothetical protein